MKVTVMLFARACELAGVSEFELELQSHSTVSQFRTALNEKFPALLPIAASLFVAIDSEYADDDQVIIESNQIACFPPVSGG